MLISTIVFTMIFSIGYYLGMLGGLLIVFYLKDLVEVIGEESK